MHLPGISATMAFAISTGLITVYLPGKELLVDHFVYFNPEKEILGPTWLAIKIEEQDDLSLLQLIQGGYQNGENWDWFYAAVKDTWPRALEALKEYLEHHES